MISQTYDLNLIPSQIPVTIHCSQYDDGSRAFVFNLYEGASAFIIPAGASATFSGVKPDGLGFQYACSITGASQVSVDVALQMTAVAGDCPCKVTVYDTDSNVLGSALCVLDVERHPLQDDTVISDSDFPKIQEVANFVEHFQPSDFVATNQGVAQAGKVLGIGADGMVTPVESGGGTIDAEDVTYWRQPYDYVSDALDSLFNVADSSYITDGYVDTTMDSADRVPFFDVSTPQRKNITLSNFINTIAPNFGSQLSLVDLGTTRAIALKDKDGTILNSITLNPRANNTSYVNTTSGLSATNVQGAVDEVDSAVDGLGTAVSGLESQVSTLISSFQVSVREQGCINGSRAKGIEWELDELMSLVRAGQFDKFAIGDYFVDSAINREFAIAGKNHYAPWQFGGSTKVNHIVCCPFVGLATKYKYNASTNTNAGGYAASLMPSNMETEYAKLSAKTRGYCVKTKIYENNKGAWEATMRSMRLPTVMEITGDRGWASTEMFSNGVCGQLPLFKSVLFRILDADWYWTADPSSFDTTYFCGIYSGGNSTSSGATNQGSVRPLIVLA